MENNGKVMVMASFVADSLALGAHWIYDTESISQIFGRVDSLLKPGRHSYHPTKEKGEFTHYGDQTLVLLVSLAKKGNFDISDFSTRWQALFKGYQGYVDQATRGTLSRYAEGRTPEDGGSLSNDLAGASRIAPLVYCLRHDLERMVEAARQQTRMTHNDPLTIESAAFFSMVAFHVLEGISPVDAIESVSQEHFKESPLSKWVAVGLESKREKSVSAISQFGQSCHTEEAFPGVVHLIARYERDLKEALIQSVMAGGDSAARGMLVGMVLGAYLGPESIPQEWLSELKKREHITELLGRLL
jgi:ADP-ribosylglycohydrolase